MGRRKPRGHHRGGTRGLAQLPARTNPRGDVARLDRPRAAHQQPRALRAGDLASRDGDPRASGPRGVYTRTGPGERAPLVRRRPPRALPRERRRHRDARRDRRARDRSGPRLRRDLRSQHTLPPRLLRRGPGTLPEAPVSPRRRDHDVRGARQRDRRDPPRRSPHGGRAHDDGRHHRRPRAGLVVLDQPPCPRSRDVVYRVRLRAPRLTRGRGRRGDRDRRVEPRRLPLSRERDRVLGSADREGVPRRRDRRQRRSPRGERHGPGDEPHREPDDDGARAGAQRERDPGGHPPRPDRGEAGGPGGSDGRARRERRRGGCPDRGHLSVARREGPRRDRSHARPPRERRGAGPLGGHLGSLRGRLVRQRAPRGDDRSLSPPPPGRRCTSGGDEPPLPHGADRVHLLRERANAASADDPGRAAVAPAALDRGARPLACTSGALTRSAGLGPRGRSAPRTRYIRR